MIWGQDFLAAMLAAAAALIICLAARPLARHLRVIDYPDGVRGRKQHARPTPLVGGLAVMVPTLAALLFLAPGSYGFGLVAALSVMVMLLLGLLDDRADLAAALRLAVCAVTLAVAIEISPDMRLHFLRFSFLDQTILLGGVGSVTFTVLCLLALQNAVNMADGKNGLVIGMSLCWSGLLWLSLPAGMSPILAVFTAALAVTFLFNLNGRLFLGDAGSYSISIFIGLLAIYAYNQGFDRLPADSVALWFWVPMLDMLRLIISRVGRGQPPFKGDRTHFHHLLYAVMPWRYGLMLYLALVLVPGLLALALPEFTLLLAIITTLSYGLLYIALTRRPRLFGETR